MHKSGVKLTVSCFLDDDRTLIIVLWVFRKYHQKHFVFKRFTFLDLFAASRNSQFDENNKLISVVKSAVCLNIKIASWKPEI